MDEKLEKKLKKLLSKAGIEESKIEEVVADLKEEDAPAVEETEKVEVEEGETEKVEETPETPAPEIPAEEVADTTEVVEGEGEQPEELPTPEPVEAAPVEEAPVVPETPEVPPYDAQADVEELKKANEGLLARISALEEALKKSGIMEEEETTVGVDENKTPANPDEVGWDETLNHLNRNSF